MGPAPGDPGPVVILGHLDTIAGPAVFGRLSALRPGDEIAVERESGVVVRFRVQRVVSYPMDHFPTADVYGLTTGPELRLITCTGWYSLSSRRYSNNLVVYASRVSS